MGFEGATVLFDTWVHPLMMGLEEHLLAMFREDFEFADGASPSHLGASAPANAGRPSPESHVEPLQVAEDAVPTAPVTPAAPTRLDPPSAAAATAPWTPEAEKELKKIPFFVRGKAKRNTERFALERGLERITLETLYDAKAHFRS